MRLQPAERPLERTLALLDQRPPVSRVHDGYLDLFDATAPAPGGRIQALWLSRLGSSLYDGAIQTGSGLHERLGSLAGQRLRNMFSVPERLRLRQGAVVLDIGSGPGNITRGLARATGETGLVVGVDVSRAMLARAVRGTKAPQVVYTRADAAKPPFSDGAFDAVVSSACLHLLPDPWAALDEMQRLLRPGGRLALTAPATLPGALRGLTNIFQRAGEIRLFDPGELRQALEHRGFADVEDRSSAGVQILDAAKPT